jgi:hypothetical protein
VKCCALTAIEAFDLRWTTSSDNAPISTVGDDTIDKHSTAKVSFPEVAMTHGELLRFIGVLLLSNRFEFGSRASLWSTIGSKYIPAASFGKTGMARSRFDAL